jgi:NAD-dependent deacetylase
MSFPLRSIVVLTGAGVSAESGINTFRATDGLWENHRIEEVATPEGFERNPQLVHHFYNERRRLLQQPDIQPNPAHLALARFEREFTTRCQGRFLLITQNIDNLHEQAGSRNLLHMHGELLKMRCQHSHMIFDINSDLTFDNECRCCLSTGNLRPHVVWFGEMPLYMPQISRALEQCDLFISMGTSGKVYPAAGFYQIAKRNSARTVELNLERTGSDFDEHIYGPASREVPVFLDELLESALAQFSRAANSAGK